MGQLGALSVSPVELPISVRPLDESHNLRCSRLRPVRENLGVARRHDFNDVSPRIFTIAKAPRPTGDEINRVDPLATAGTDDLLNEAIYVGAGQRQMERPSVPVWHVLRRALHLRFYELKQLQADAVGEKEMGLVCRTEFRAENTGRLVRTAAGGSKQSRTHDMRCAEDPTVPVDRPENVRHSKAYVVKCERGPTSCDFRQHGGTHPCRRRKPVIETDCHMPAAKNGSERWKFSTATRSVASTRKKLPIGLCPSSDVSGPDMTVFTP